MKFAEIAVDSPVGHSRTFTYEIPEHLNLLLGSSVLVPFGKRTLQGIVFHIADSASVDQTKEVLSLVDNQPLLDEVNLSLARWISNYYVCSLFEACALMLPPGSRKRSDVWVEFSLEDFSVIDNLGSDLSKFESGICKYIFERKKVRLDALTKRFGEGARSVVSKLEHKGFLKRSYEVRDSRVRPRFSYRLTLNCAGSEFFKNENFGRAYKQRKLVQHIATEGLNHSLTFCRQKYGHSVVKATIDKGFLKILKERIYRNPLENKVYQASSITKLTREQKRSLSSIIDMMDRCDVNPRALLLNGVTGSGKTEVYIEAVNHCIQLRKKAIVLVPEIALTPQTIDRFASRFPGQVAVMHSALTSGERFDQWTKIRNGDYNVVIGSRSAIFAPIDSLGLVVIDEEHEWTYKNNESSPRYHSRDVAMQLAGLTRATVVLGSASPDVGSYLRALRGRYRLSQLSSRFIESENRDSDARQLASVRVVDMREELRNGNDHILSNSLYSHLTQTIAKGEQAILFLNRRGSSSFTQCRSCGHVFKCSSCDISYTYHGVSNKLQCHYCGRHRRPFMECSSCGSSLLSRYGIGTQYLEDVINTMFPESNVLRWDRDSATRPNKYEEILDKFRSGQSQILIGTQMIAKGHHLPGVTLVGVISADVGLGLPDFRSGERSFQLLCQVAGRSGRGEKPGKVIIQTFQPDHYAITSAASQEYDQFFQIESQYRKINGYPPYSKMIRLVNQHTNESKALEESKKIASLFLQERDRSDLFDIDVIGPTPAFPARVRGHYRWQIILRGPNPRLLYDRLNLVSAQTSSSGIFKGFFVDVDPISFT